MIGYHPYCYLPRGEETMATFASRLAIPLAILAFLTVASSEASAQCNNKAIEAHIINCCGEFYIHTHCAAGGGCDGCVEEFCSWCCNWCLIFATTCPGCCCTAANTSSGENAPACSTQQTSDRGIEGKSGQQKMRIIPPSQVIQPFMHRIVTSGLRGRP